MVILIANGQFNTIVLIIPTTLTGELKLFDILLLKKVALHR